jgi:hypothetical protein
MIAVRLGVGHVYEQQDQLNVRFPNGATRVMRINKARPEAKPRRSGKGVPKPNPRDTTKEPDSRGGQGKSRRTSDGMFAAAMQRE